MDVNQEFEKWWNEFVHKENAKMDWYTATRLAFMAGAAVQQSVQSDGACQHTNIVGRDYDFQCVDCGAVNPHRR